MVRRLVVLTLIGSLGGSSFAFAGESLLQSGLRIAGDVGRVSAGKTEARLAPARAEAVQGQGEPAVVNSPMRKRTKILIYLATGVGFGLAAYEIDHHVLNITPSTLGTRKD
jgi:hypothetical protein